MDYKKVLFDLSFPHSLYHSQKLVPQDVVMRWLGSGDRLSIIRGTMQNLSSIVLLFILKIFSASVVPKETQPLLSKHVHRQNIMDTLS